MPLCTRFLLSFPAYCFLVPRGWNWFLTIASHIKPLLKNFKSHISTVQTISCDKVHVQWPLVLTEPPHISLEVSRYTVGYRPHSPTEQPLKAIFYSTLEASADGQRMFTTAKPTGKNVQYYQQHSVECEIVCIYIGKVENCC